MRPAPMFKLTAVLVLCLAGTASAAPALSDWSTAQKVDEIAGNSSELNTPSLDGCPILSPDGKSLFMASNRQPGGHGGLDIWVATRPSTDEPFGAPENLPAPINSAADDFCPTPLRGGRLLFVSRRTTAESCGMGDIYATRLNPVHGGASPAISPARPPVPTARSTSRVRRTSRSTAARSCTSRAARRSFPATSTSARAPTGRASGPPRR